MNRFPPGFAVLPLLLVPLAVAQAQTAPDAGSLRQQIERDRKPVMPGRAVPERQAEPAAMKPRTGTAIVVTNFRFDGNTLLGADRLAPAVASFLNHPLDFGQLQAAASAVAALYREAGWVVRAYLPEQDIVGGVVTIRIVEAVFGGVRHEGAAPSRVPLQNIVRMFDAQQKTGEPLNALNIDRALLLAEDLPGVTVSGSLREGAHKGESDLVVKAVDKPLFSGDAALDNTGSRSTGRERLAVNMGLASPFGIGDLVNANVLHTQGSDYLRIGGTVPVGSDGWRVGANVSHLDYKLVAPEFLALKGKGSSDSYGLDVNYPLIRSRLKNVYVNGSLDRKTFDNESGGAVTTRYKVTTATVGLNGNLFDNFGGGGANSASLSLIGGKLDLSGSPNQAADDATARTAGRFTKLRFSVSRQQAVLPTLAFYGSLAGQWAGKNLDSSEKYYLGGASGVRAYPSSEGGGATGTMLNLELRWRLPQGLSLTGFYDYGQVTVNRNNSFTGAPALNDLSLKGYGLALNWQANDSLTFKGTWARRIGNNPNPSATGNDQDGTLIRNRWWLSASLQF